MATIVWIFTFMLITSSASKEQGPRCPEACRCSLDSMARPRTLCEAGGLSDLIPVAEMTHETRVLVITGSEYTPNNLSLGPIFKELKNLEEIHLTWSGIPTLGEHSFWGLNNLKILNLTHNSLTNLVDTNFRGANSLTLLDLSHNEIESVPSAVFRHVKHLRSLSLSNNIIPKLVPRIFFGLTRLEDLDLSYNPLGDLQPELFNDVPVLTNFSCAGCGLISISGSLLNMLPKLTELNLQNNRLTQMPHKIVLLKNLHVLKLDGNHISFIEKDAIAGSSMKHLHLSHNHIIRLESGAFSNSSITHLDLSYNRLSYINSDGFSGIVSQIYDLKLSGNSLRVEDLQNILPDAENLRRLSLGDIGLTLLPAGLMHHSYLLHYLNISANYLSFLPLDFFASTPNLQELDLSMNSFRGLPKEVFKLITQAKNLRALGLKGNPWHCDKCHISPLIQWLQDSPDQSSTCDDSRVWTCLTCIGPKSLSGISLVLLPSADLPMCVHKSIDDIPIQDALPGRSIEPASFSDDKSQPSRHLPRKNISGSFIELFTDQMPLIIICICSFVVVILCVIISSVIAYSRQSAYYYTNEKEFENTSYFVREQAKSPNLRSEKSPMNGAASRSYSNETTSNGHHRNSNRNNNTEIPERPSQDTAAIATIDELADIAGSTELVDSASPSVSMPQITEISILESEPKPGTR